MNKIGIKQIQIFNEENIKDNYSYIETSDANKSDYY